MISLICVSSEATVNVLLYKPYQPELDRIYVRKFTIIVPDNGLPPGRRQAIICTNAGIMLIGPLGNKCLFLVGHPTEMLLNFFCEWTIYESCR